MLKEDKIWIAQDGETQLSIIPRLANRHGLIAGATGTGKTFTLKVMAESFVQAGVPVLLSDVKGDLAGMCKVGEVTEPIRKRVEMLGLEKMGFNYESYTTCFWDIFGKKGLPLRTTISEFGPLLLSKLLDLNQTQSDILNIVFKIADDEELLLLDLKDLKSMINYISENSATYKSEYGNISKQSTAAIIRALVALGDRGGDIFFGEPALDIHDWFRTDASGRGVINILDASSLIHDTSAYAMFMLWILAELFESMPEVGDLEKPKMVFFFDEAHLLFDDLPKALSQKIEQVMKLIRSKGIGVYFITQNPSDIPDDVLAQLGNKVQHALRAYTPSEQKAIRAAATSYRSNATFDTEKTLAELKTGEALVSFLEEDGSPAMVRRALILPPQSYAGTIDDMMRASVISMNDLAIKYKDTNDRDSAYEFLQRLYNDKLTKEEKEKQETLHQKQQEKDTKAKSKEEEADKKRLKRNVVTVAGSAVGTVGRELGKNIGNSIGGSLGKKIGGNVGATFFRGILKTLFKS